MSMVSTTHLANQSFREAFVIPCQPAKTRCPTKTALLVAPIFSSDGKVKYYLPQGERRNLLTDEVVQGESGAKNSTITSAWAYECIMSEARRGAAFSIFSLKRKAQVVKI